jgi:TonB family protein
MAVLWTTPELASRFAPYIEELHEFFASYGMHYGSPEDMVPLAERLDASGTFAEDMSSMVRAIILRQGGSMPRADLLEIIAVAIGGQEIDQAAQELQPPVHKLLGFLNGVLRRPWNEPPGQDLPSPARRPLEFPAARVAPAFIRPESVFSRFDSAEASPEPQPVAEPTPVLVAESMPALVASPSPEPKPTSVAESIPTVASFPPPEAPAFRFAAAISALRSSAPSEAAPIRLVEPIPTLASFLQPEATPVPAAEPSARPASVAAPGGRPWQAAHLLLSRFNFAWPPRLNFAWPPRSNFALPLRTISPPMRSALMVGSGVFLVAIFLILFLHRTSPSPTASDSLGIPTATATYAPASVPAPTVVPAPVPIPMSKPSPDGPVLSSRQRFGRTARSEEIIADPYSTPIPGQNTAPVERRSAPGRSNAAEPSASDFSPGTASIATAPAPTRASAAPVDPDSTFVGASSATRPSGSERFADSSRGSADRPTTPAYSGSPSSRGRYLSVSSGVMAHNLISSPAPNYPMLARIAHIQGQVILQAVIAKDGSVSATHVLRGHRLLRGAATDAVSRWRFRPYMMEGRPVDVSTIVTVDFDGAH